MKRTKPQTAAISDDDSLTMVIVVGFLLLTAAGSAGLFWARVITWLVQNKVLVSASSAPIVVLPGGAGLDLARLLVLAAVVVAAAAAAVSTIHRRRAFSQVADQ